MRASGILMHITSLPSSYGIGTMGREAYEFLDFLEKSGQKYWQILPLGPTGDDNCPYRSESSFAGNPSLIDLDELIQDGLLLESEVHSLFGDGESGSIDYGAVYSGRTVLLRMAYRRGWARDAERVKAFYAENKSWLRDYALYTALKRHYGMHSWPEWENEILRLRLSEGVLRIYEDRLREEVEQCIYTQYLFFRQWDALHDCARERGICIIGDVPMYVPLDSCDVWVARENYQLDASGRPRAVSGLPPELPGEPGQLWGEPLYDWEHMEKDGFAWWTQRMTAAVGRYDVVRLTHFRALDRYWMIPCGETDAGNGKWQNGPGMKLINALYSSRPELPWFAENLGVLSPSAKALREYSCAADMRVMQYAFDSRIPSEHLPHRLEKDTVLYSGTHDQPTLREWLEESDESVRGYVREYFGLNEREGEIRGILRGGMSSPAELFIAPMQDWLALGKEGRMNKPGQTGKGWRWRVNQNMLTDSLANEIRRMTKLYGR